MNRGSMCRGQGVQAAVGNLMLRLGKCSLVGKVGGLVPAGRVVEEGRRGAGLDVVEVAPKKGSSSRSLKSLDW